MPEPFDPQTATESAIRSEQLLRLQSVSHAFFTRLGGASSGLYASLNGGQGSSDDRAAILENRARMAAIIGVAPTHLVSVHQVHSPDIVVVTEPWSPDQRPKADGMVTRMRGIALGVASADCGPLLFADGEAGVVGACHAGWKGAFTGVIEATVAEMEALGAERRRIVACLGMTIGPENYEVGPEFRARFVDAEAGSARFFSDASRPGHAMFDLPGYIMARLDALGLGTSENLGLCTYADERRFYSYRRTTHRGEADYGRHLSAIALIG